MELQSKSILQPNGTLSFKCHLTLDDESVLTKTLSFENYLNLLKEGSIAVTQKEKFLTICDLPIGYHSGAIRSDGDFVMFITVPSSVRTKFYKEQFFEIPYPNLLFGFVSVNNKLVSKKCFSYKGVLTDKSILYRYPFGNVNQNGHICFGNISLPKADKPPVLNTYIDLFMNGITNDDYYKPGSSITSSYSQGTLLTRLSKKSVFPSALLSKTNYTYTKLKEELFNEQ